MPAIAPHKTAVDTTSSWDGPAAVAAAPNDAKVLRYMHAWVDGKADATLKGSYKFPHHKPGTDTAANIRGVNNGLARLSNSSIPEGDKPGVEKHLRKHRTDAGLKAELSELEMAEALGENLQAKGTGHMQYKILPQFIKELNAETRSVTGIFAVHGNIDEGGDMSVNGSFAKQLADGRQRTRFLWMHNAYNPPIASIQSIQEVEKADLPEAVLKWAPEATGGVQVTRKYYEGVDLADWVFKSLQEDDVNEMSYAYDPVVFEMINDENRPKLKRILKEVKLFDISDVNWGMNPATTGVKGFPANGMTFVQHSAMVEATIEEFLERVQDRKTARAREDRTLSEANRRHLAKMIEAITTILCETEPLADEGAVISEYAKFMRMEALIRGVV